MPLPINKYLLAASILLSFAGVVVFSLPLWGIFFANITKQIK
jgi:hypothetical protein